MNDSETDRSRRRSAERSDTASTVPDTFDPSPKAFRKTRPNDRFTGASGVLFEQAMAQTRMAICLCDPKAPDVPIVFANRAFRDLTGYDDEDIVGRNCRFLQGPDTDQAEVAKIREAVAKEDVVVVELLNYRKDGTPFWNALHLGPIYNEAGELIYFFGSQWNVSDVRAARAEEIHAREMARELSHRMKNMFAVISGIVNITGRMRGINAEAREINDRVQALARAYETTLDSASTGTIEIGPAIRAILEPYASDEARLRVLGNGLHVPFSTVSGISLCLHELAANATKHGAWSGDEGQVKVDWARVDHDDGARLVVTWRENGVRDMPEKSENEGSGNAIIDRMIAYGGGKIDRDWQKDGLNVTLSYPLFLGQA